MGIARTAVLLLLAAAASAGCDLLMTELSRGTPDAGEPDADVGEFCPGYTGDNECCTPDDWCMYADDGFCDCDGFCEWEESDCSTDTDSDTDTDTDSDTDTDTDTDTDPDTDADAGKDFGQANACIPHRV